MRALAAAMIVSFALGVVGGRAALLGILHSIFDVQAAPAVVGEIPGKIQAAAIIDAVDASDKIISLRYADPYAAGTLRPAQVRYDDATAVRGLGSTPAENVVPKIPLGSRVSVIIDRTTGTLHLSMIIINPSL